MVVKGQLRDIACCIRWFLVNVLKTVSGFKTFVNSKEDRHSVGQSSLWLWGAAAAAQGSAASGALKDRGSERVCSVVHEEEQCCSQSLLGATVSTRREGKGRKKEYLSIFGKVTNLNTNTL